MMMQKEATGDEQPLVSVAIPAYNAGAYIGDTIESIMRQTYPHWQLTVYENGSTDNTRAVVASYQDERICLLADDEFVPMAAGFARCTEKVEGDFLQIICADDILHPTCLETKVRAASAPENAGCVLISSSRMLISPAGRNFSTLGYARKHCRATLHEVLSEVVYRGNPIGDWTCALIRTSALSSPLPFTGRMTIDISYYLRLLTRGDLLNLPQTLSSFRLSGVSGREFFVHYDEYVRFYQDMVSPHFSGWRRLYYYCGYGFITVRFVLRHLVYFWMRK